MLLVALATIVAVNAWAIVLFVRSGWYTARQPNVSAGDVERLTWVFLVPALDEELTIADSVARLLDVPVVRKHIVVIDDASTDRTPAILAEIAHPDLHVVRRELPNARRGKAAALNHAYEGLAGRLGDVDRASVIVVVVDADGRLHPSAPLVRRGSLCRPLRGRRPVARAHLQPGQRVDLVPERRVRRVRAPVPGRPERLGNGRHGRKRPVQPPLRTRRRRRRARAVARTVSPRTRISGFA